MRDPSSDYRLFQKIGRGGMGQVFAGVRVGLGDMVVPCVIKVLHPELADTPRDRERFREEARIAAQLDHGRIVKVIDSGEMQGCPYLVMERVDGVSLRELTQRTSEAGMPRLDLDVSLFIVGEILAALQYAHYRTIGGKDAGVVHYDVTPGNILISSSGEVKLTDFGIARFAATCEGTLSRSIGTPRYMSPEQFLGQVRRETDIYSLGVVLHELLDGKRYLSDLSMDQFRAHVISGPPAELERRDIPKWLDDLRRRMLAPRAEDRPAASDARTVLLENCNRYHLASPTITKLYSTVIGQQRSGLTDHLESLREEIQRYRDTAGVLKVDEGMVGMVGTKAEQAPTTFEEEEKVDVDAVPVLLRKDRSPRATPTGDWETKSHTNTREPAIEATERLAPFEILGLSAKVVPAPAPAQPDRTENVTMRFPTSMPAPELAPVVVIAATSVPAPVPAQAESRIVATPTPVAAPAQRSHRLMWVVGGMGLLILVLMASVIWLLAGPQGDADKQAAATDPGTAEPPVAVVSETSAKAAEVPLEPAPEPEVQIVAPPVEPEPAPLEPVQAESTISQEPIAEPIAEPEQAVAPRKREPAKAIPKVEVSFIIPGVTKAEIKVGGRTIPCEHGAFTKLKPGKYPVQWRPTDSQEWRKSGTLTIAALPAGEYYDVKLGAKDLVAKAKKEGSQ